MVRLEKIAWERIVNTSVLGRARVITRPRKWHVVNPNEQIALQSYGIVKKSLLGKIFGPLLNWFYVIQTNWQKGIIHQQGLAWEDKFVHDETELRRDTFFEHMARENLHPYHWLLKFRRRERYYKVERGVKGFFVPEHVRKEAESQTLGTAIRLKRQWDNFTYKNYWSDMTPSARPSVVPKLIPLELIVINGLFAQEGWDQYFYNEKNDYFYTEEQLKKVRDPRLFPFDLTSAEGRKAFEKKVTELDRKIPGVIIPAGEKLDFQKIYEGLGVVKAPKIEKKEEAPAAH